MSRSGYTEDGEQWAHIMWRGAVKSAIKGKRGQLFLVELLAALEAMPDRKLITEELEASGQYCTLGVIGASRKIDMSKLDPEDPKAVAQAFGIAGAMVQEITYENDEHWQIETPEQLWRRMARWVSNQIVTPPNS